jgi:DNA-binding NarL/FixJ family response regulator
VSSVSRVSGVQDRRLAGDEREGQVLSLVLADHHPLTLSGLCQLFEKEPGCAVVAACSDTESALDAVRKHSPAIVVLDIELPLDGAFMVLNEVRRERLSTQVVLLASRLEDHQVVEAVRLGARGVVLKEMSPETLVQCVWRVNAGELCLEKAAVGPALNRLVKAEVAIRQAARGLTPRETEIVRLAIKGVPTKDIATRLAVRQGTVKVHLHNIYDKLQVDGRLGLILFARKHGLM